MEKELQKYKKKDDIEETSAEFEQIGSKLAKLVKNSQQLISERPLTYSEKLSFRNELYCQAFQIFSSTHHNISNTRLTFESEPNIILETSQLVLAIVYPERFEKSELRSLTSIANTKRIADMVRDYITSSTSEEEKQF